MPDTTWNHDHVLDGVTKEELIMLLRELRGEYSMCNPGSQWPAVARSTIKLLSRVDEIVKAYQESTASLCAAANIDLPPQAKEA